MDAKLPDGRYLLRAPYKTFASAAINRAWVDAIEIEAAKRKLASGITSKRRTGTALVMTEAMALLHEHIGYPAPLPQIGYEPYINATALLYGVTDSDVIRAALHLFIEQYGISPT